MLRLHPTQIKLEGKDYKWHKPRYEHRQELRAGVTPADITNQLRKSPNKYNDARTGRRIAHSVLEQAAVRPEVGRVQQRDTSLYSHEPVPTGSRAFWDRVLAEAGTPTRSKATSLGNANVVDPSDDFLDTTHSSRVSIEDGTTEGQYAIDDYDQGDQFGRRQLFHGSCAEDEHSSLQQTPKSSEESKSVDSVEKPPVIKQHTQNDTSKHRLSWLPFHRKARQAIANTIFDDDDGQSSSMAVDGPSDRHHGCVRKPFRDSDIDMDFGDDGLYGNRRDRRTISPSLEVVDGGAVAHHPTSSPRAPHERPSLTYVTGRQLPRHFRQPSGSIPRSSLHISQAAASSSPNVLQTGSAGHHGRPRVPRSPGLLAYPPRRARRYRPRSETYSYEESAEFNTLDSMQLGGHSSARATTAALPSLMVSYPPLSSAPSSPIYNSIRIVTPQASNEFLNASPPEVPIGAPYSVSPGQVRGDYNTTPPRDEVHYAIHHSTSSIGSYQDRPDSVHSHPSSETSGIRNNHPASSHNPSSLESSQSFLGSFHRTPSRGNLSPFAQDFVPPSTRRHATPPFTLPPPFSATPRNVSFNLAIPSSSPRSPHTPPQPRTGQRVPSISEIPSPGSPLRIPVYDDRRSPTNQPQTPAGLRRNGLPVMATHNPFGPRNPPATAPARPRGGHAPAIRGSTSGTARVADWRAFATPTRRPLDRYNRPFDVYDEEIENDGRMTGEERAYRREVMLQQPVRMGREESERMERGLVGRASPRRTGRELRELAGVEWGL